MVREKEGEDGRLVLVLKRKESRFFNFLSKFFNVPEEKRFALDDMGYWVWERCSGENTVGEIIEQLSEEFKISRREAEISLMSFLKTLSKKKLIGFALPEEERNQENV